MKIDPTWKDVDELVKLQHKGNPVSISKLSEAFAKDDKPNIRKMIAALRNDLEDYEAEIYPYETVRLAMDTHIRRDKKYFEEGTLVSSIYVAAIAKIKSKEDSPSLSEKLDSMKARTKTKPKSTAGEMKKHKAKRGRGRSPKKEEQENDTVKSKEEDIVKSEEKEKKITDYWDQINFENLKSNDELGAYVPTKDENYVFPNWVLEFVNMVDNGINVWLYGGTGAGKSSLAEQICAKGSLPLMYQSFHEDIKPDQLFGGKDLVDGNTVWVDGPITKAYREGFVLLLDEIDGLPPEIQFCLYGVLDRKPLVLAENGNEVVMPHKNFRVIATGNTLGRGDEYGMFAGTNVLNRAFLNRFRVWYKVDYPGMEIYRAIIRKEGISAKVANIVSRLAKEINSAFLNGTLTETFSLRDAREISRVAELCEGNVSRALQLTLLNRLSSVEQASVNEMFRRLVPDDL